VCQLPFSALSVGLVLSVIASAGGVTRSCAGRVRAMFAQGDLCEPGLPGQGWWRGDMVRFLAWSLASLCVRAVAGMSGCAGSVCPMLLHICPCTGASCIAGCDQVDLQNLGRRCRHDGYVQ
jgi:hypothetical protein